MNTMLTDQHTDLLEPTLTDYWIVVLRRWKLLLAVAVLTAASVTLYGFQAPPISPYPYRTVIEVEDVETLQSKIQRLYIPSTLEEEAKREGYTEERYVVTVESAGNIIALSSVVHASDAEDIFRIHKRIADLVLQNQKKAAEMKRINITKALYQNGLEKDLNKIQGRLLGNKLDRIQEIGKLLDQQIAQLRQSIGISDQKKQTLISAEAQRPSNSESLATTILLLEDDLRRKRQDLNQLEERREIALKAERDAIEFEQLQNNQRTSQLEQETKSLEIELSSVQEARILIPPSRVLRKPFGSRPNILLFAAALGLLLGFLAVFFAEFHSRALLRLKQQRSMLSQ